MCNCKGWGTKKEGKPRRCIHVDTVIGKYNLHVFPDGDFLRTSTMTSSAGKPITIPAPVIDPDAPKLNTSVVSGFKVFRVVSKPVVDEPASVVTPVEAVVPVEADNPDAMFVFPMLSSHIEVDWDDVETNWVAEEKYDGHRMIVHVDATRNVYAWARPGAGELMGKPRTLPPHILSFFHSKPELVNYTFDGELYVPGGTSTDVTALDKQDKLVLVLFDVLRADGVNFCNLKFKARRDELEFVLGTCLEGKVPPSHPVQIPMHHQPDEATLASMWAAGKEGLILKKLSAQYQPGVRSNYSIKLKKENSMVCTVYGYEDGKLGKNSILKVRLPDRKHTTVKVRNTKILKAIQADPENFIGEQVRIKYQDITSGGVLRHPRFDRWENIV